MASGVPRRTLLGSVGVAVTAGCLSDEPDNTGGSDDKQENSGERERYYYNSDDIPDECDIRTRNQQGQADPVETTVEIEQSADETEECLSVASEVVLERMDEQLGLDLTDPEPKWIGSNTGNRTTNTR